MSGEGKVSKTVADLLEDISGKAKTIRDDAFAAGRYDGYSIGFFNGQEQGEKDGYDKGRNEGYNDGKEDGIEEGKEIGRNESYNDGYNDGKEDGIEEGKEIGRDEGYNAGKEDGIEEGKEIGRDEGYNAGYIAGKAEGEGNGLDTSDADAKASDILKDKTAYVKGQKVVGNIPSVDQAVPVIEFDVNTGKINASAEQTAGYVKGGTAYAEKVELKVQKGTVLTPTQSKYIGVDAHTYVNGAIWIDAIPDTYVEEDPIDTRIDEIIAVQLEYLTLPTLTVVFPDLQTEIECKFVEGWDWNTFVSSYYNTNNLFSIGADGAVLVKDINGYYGDNTKSTTFNDGNANKVYGTWKMQEGFYWA